MRYEVRINEVASVSCCWEDNKYWSLEDFSAIHFPFVVVSFSNYMYMYIANSFTLSYTHIHTLTYTLIQITLEFYERKKGRWLLPAENVNWEVWHLTLTVAELSSEQGTGNHGSQSVYLYACDLNSIRYAQGEKKIILKTLLACIAKFHLSRGIN